MRGHSRVGWLTGASLGLIVACAGCGGGDGDGSSPGNPWAYEIEHLFMLVSTPSPTDVLLVVDDSPAMRPFQATLARSLEGFMELVPEVVDWSPCSPVRLGVLAAGGDGRLADQVGTLTWEGDEPSVSRQADPSCRVVGPENLDCLYDPVTSSGTALVGFEGSPYPRGLSALGRFLQGEEAAEFLRPEATLVVIYISAGEDCGEPGEVAEGLPGMDGRICAYAAKGVGPDGSTSHPDDPLHLPYALSPVDSLYDQLMALKGNRTGMVKFAAIVGLTDSEHPEATAIEYQGAGPSAAVTPACTLAGCTGEGCGALPGTRAIALASAFGIGDGGYGGMAAPICMEDWGGGIIGLGGFSSCPRVLHLARPLLDPALLAFFVNGAPLSRYSCATDLAFIPCEGLDDPACDCVETYHYFSPSDPGNPYPLSPGGVLEMADHYDPCSQCPGGPGTATLYELWYVVAP